MELMRCFSLSVAANVRCEDALIQQRNDDLDCDLFAVFDGTTWRHVFETGAFEVAQEVVSVFPQMVWNELRRTGLGASAAQQGSKRGRPASADAAISRALHRAVVALDDHLFSFEGSKNERFGVEAGGSLLALLHHKGAVYSICVGDCEGAAFYPGRVEQRLSTWPHNCNFAKEMEHIRSAFGLSSRDCFFYDEERKLFFFRDLQTTRFLGAWRCKLQCRHQNADRQLCNLPCEKGKFFCQEHALANFEKGLVMSYWEPEIRVLRDFDFIVIASDGLWDMFTTGRACEIVANLPSSQRAKAPKILLDNCLEQAVFAAPKKHKHPKVETTTMSFLSQLNSQTRRLVHDDTSVMVLFSNYEEPISQQVAEFEDDLKFQDAEDGPNASQN